MNLYCVKEGDIDMKKYIVGLIVFLFMINLVACSDDNTDNTEGEKENQSVEVTEEEKLPADEVVVVVNGEEVTGKTYNLVYTQEKLYKSQFEEDIDLDDIKESTINLIIDRQILFQEAKKEGIEITEEQASKELERIKEESPETLEILLAQFQITEEDFKDQLIYELTMFEYMDKVIEVSVSEEELEEYYKKAKEGNENIPEYDEIKHSLRSQLTELKTQEALQAKIDEARENAKIDKKI